MNTESKPAGLIERYSAHIPNFKPLAWGVFLVLSALGLLHNYLYYGSFGIAYLDYAEIGDLLFAFVTSLTVVVSKTWFMIIFLVFFYGFYAYLHPYLIIRQARYWERKWAETASEYAAAKINYRRAKQFREQMEEIWNGTGKFASKAAVIEVQDDDFASRLRNKVSGQKGFKRFIAKVIHMTTQGIHRFFTKILLGMLKYLLIFVFGYLLIFSGLLQAKMVKDECVPTVVVTRTDETGIFRNHAESSTLLLIGNIGDYLFVYSSSNEFSKTIIFPHGTYVTTIISLPKDKMWECSAFREFLEHPGHPWNW